MHEEQVFSVCFQKFGEVHGVEGKEPDFSHGKGKRSCKGDAVQ